MKKVKICYSRVDNLGDLINPIIVKEVLKYKPVWTKPSICNISGIGSGLKRYFVPKEKIDSSLKLKLLYKIKKIYDPELIIWSAGFICHEKNKLIPLRNNVKISSVRGELSKKKLEEIYGELKDVTTGDAGLLASELIKKPWEKEYKLGIIPHIREREEKEWKKIANEIDGSIIIDVTDDPMKNLEIISKCECIISSSLHGLIIADSFNIPNARVVLTDKLVGDGFKFKDYYSIYNIDPSPIDLNKNNNIDIEKIVKDYEISKEQVEIKKKEIKEAFYKYLK